MSASNALVQKKAIDATREAACYFALFCTGWLTQIALQWCLAGSCAQKNLHSDATAVNKLIVTSLIDIIGGGMRKATTTGVLDCHTFVHLIYECCCPILAIAIARKSQTTTHLATTSNCGNPIDYSVCLSFISVGGVEPRLFFAPGIVFPKNTVPCFLPFREKEDFPNTITDGRIIARTSYVLVQWIEPSSEGWKPFESWVLQGKALTDHLESRVLNF